MIRTSLDVPLLSPALPTHRKRYLRITAVTLILLAIWGVFVYVVSSNNKIDDCNEMFIMTTALGNALITLYVIMFAGGNYFHHKTKSIVLELQLVTMSPIYGLMMVYSFSDCAKENTLASAYIKFMFMSISLVILLLICSILINLCHWVCLARKVEFGENDEQECPKRPSTISEATSDGDMASKHDVNNIV